MASMFGLGESVGTLTFARRALGQWLLWVFASMLAFTNGWSVGRTLALTLGEAPGADLGEAGIVILGLGLGPAFGAPTFVVGFLGVAALLLFPVIAVWGETGVGPGRSRASLGIALFVYFMVSFWTSGLLSWLVAPRFAPILGQPLPKALNSVLWLALLWMYLRRRLPRLAPGALSQLARRTMWLTAALAAVAVAVVATARPWLGNGRCPDCGSVPSAFVGVQFGVLSGLALLWQFRGPGTPHE